MFGNAASTRADQNGNCLYRPRRGDQAVLGIRMRDKSSGKSLTAMQMLAKNGALRVD